MNDSARRAGTRLGYYLLRAPALVGPPEAAEGLTRAEAESLLNRELEPGETPHLLVVEGRRGALRPVRHGLPTGVAARDGAHLPDGPRGHRDGDLPALRQRLPRGCGGS